MEITKYIKDLLFLHDCVILPGFGGFVANYKSAKIDEARNIFLPPSKDIGFNRNLNQNDGLLINRLVEAEKMSYSEAEKSAAFFVENLSTRINRNEKVVLDDLGCFFNDKQLNLQFEPNRKTNFLVDAMGMESFTILRLRNLKGKKQVFELNQTQSSLKSHSLRYAAVGIPVFIALAIFPLKLQHEDDIQYTGLDIINAVTENIMSSVYSSTYGSVAEISEESEFVHYTPSIGIEANKSVSTKIIEPLIKGKYYLIAGNFATLENAEVLKEELIKKSYPAIIIKSLNLYLVAVSIFDTRESAKEFEKKVTADNPKSNCWIMKG